MVRVVPEGAVRKEFDYLVPEGADASLLEVGTLVRVELGARRVKAWIVAVDAEPAGDRDLKPLAKLSGLGPPADVVDLTTWAARRWVAPRATFLTTASPPSMVRALPPRPADRPVPTGPPTAVADAARSALDAGGVVVVRVPPATDTYPVVVEAARRGPVLVVAPSVDRARAVGVALRRTGVDVAVLPKEWAAARAGARVVIGARAAAFAPVVDAASFVLLDEHAEVHQEEGSPTWHARDVLVERARRLRVPCLLVSPCPSLEALRFPRLVTLPRAAERSGWPVLDVVDLRTTDPGEGLLTGPLVRRLRDVDGVAVCVLNRKGRAGLLACRACNAVNRCEHCEAAVVQRDEQLVCPRCATERPPVCDSCGSTALKRLRPGVSRLADELAVLLGEPVDEITGAGAEQPSARVVVGTEAALHRVPSAALVAFLDVDQELLAPRYRAADEALALLVLAGRAVGGRSGGGRVLVQTRLPDHEVVQAALHGDPERVADAERERRARLGLPPARHVAQVSGVAAPAFIERLGSPVGVEVTGPGDDGWLVRSDDLRTLVDALAAVERPSGRLRLALDPMRL